MGKSQTRLGLQLAIGKFDSDSVLITNATRVSLASNTISEHTYFLITVTEPSLRPSLPPLYRSLITTVVPNSMIPALLMKPTTKYLPTLTVLSLLFGSARRMSIFLDSVSNLSPEINLTWDGL